MSISYKHIWVTKTLYQAGERGLSLQEINQKWLKTDFSCGEPISRQSFDRWKGQILDLLGVIIDCRRKGGYRYYISNPEVLQRGHLNRWLLDTYSTLNTLSQNIALKDRILTEEIPSSRYFLQDILEAMQESRIIEITYKNFHYRHSYTFPVAPYCIKMFQKRWYMLALSIKDNILRIYNLDRITDLEFTDQNFTLPDDFHAQSYFSSYFGIVHDEKVQIQRIVIRADKNHQHYLRTLPLHDSQKEIFTCEEYADFELYLRPTYDFCMELLRPGAMIRVLEPESLRQRMKTLAQEILDLYHENLKDTVEKS